MESRSGSNLMHFGLSAFQPYILGTNGTPCIMYFRLVTFPSAGTGKPNICVTVSLVLEGQHLSPLENTRRFF